MDPMSNHTFFSDVIDREAWEPIQQRLAIAMRMEIHVLGPDGADLCPPSGLSRFRDLLHASDAFEAQSLSTRRDLIVTAAAAGRMVIEETFTGRLRFALPILYGGEHVATVTGGGVVEQPMSPERIQSLADDYSVDVNELSEAAETLPIANQQVCQASGLVIGALLSRIVDAMQLRERARLRARRLKILSEVGHTVASSLDTLKVLDTVVEVIPRILNVKAVVVTLFDERRESLRIRASRGVTDEFLTVRFEPGRGLLGTVASTGRPLNVPDMLVDPRNAYVEHDRRESLRALLAAPLLDGEQVLGVIGAFADQPHSFTGGDEQMLSSLADYAATALRNARLYEQLNRAYRELGAATRRLQDTQERLFHSDKLATLGRVAGDTAHEMKNTLGGIIGAASTVRDQFGELTEDQIREMLAAIAEEGWRLRDTIEAVRGYAKPPSRDSEAQDVRQTIDEAVRLLRFDRSLMRLPIEVECADELAFEGDRDRLKQVLINLLRNAVEAFEGVDDRAPRIQIEAEPDDRWAVIRVRDNGIGIPPDRIERIWEPFFTTKGALGTGLGLDNVRQIVRAQGGEIEVASEADVGTTFTLRLPLAEKETAAA